MVSTSHRPSSISIFKTTGESILGGSIQNHIVACFCVMRYWHVWFVHGIFLDVMMILLILMLYVICQQVWQIHTYIYLSISYPASITDFRKLKSNHIPHKRWEMQRHWGGLWYREWWSESTQQKCLLPRVLLIGWLTFSNGNAGIQNTCALNVDWLIWWHHQQLRYGTSKDSARYTRALMLFDKSQNVF